MKGLIFDIRSFSVHDGPGIRQTIFLKGCPMRCLWCHNPESHESVEEIIPGTKKIGKTTFIVNESVGRYMSLSEVMTSIQSDIPFFEESGGGVTISGGEPLYQPGFTAALLKACKSMDIHTALDTCGYADLEAFEKVLPFTDLLLYDLKLADDEKHRRFTGVDNQAVLRNLEAAAKAGKSITVRIPLIAGITDTDENLSELFNIIQRTRGVNRIDLLPYHKTAHAKYERMQKPNQYPEASPYNMNSALEIRSFFMGAAPVVSIGG